MVELSNVALTIILVLVTLFIGLYTVNTVADLQDMTDLYDYTTTTSFNSSTGVINGSQTHTANFTVGFLDQSITGDTGTQRISVIANNTGPNAITVNVSLNGANVGSFSATNNENTTGIIDDVTFLGESTTNNVTVGANVVTDDADNVTALGITIVYPSGNTTTDIYDIQQDLIDSTSTTFEVLILVMIIVALGIAIAVLKGGFGAGSTVSAI